jgi:hypothetical protein
MIEIAKYILADKEEKRLKRERLKEFLSHSGTANMYNLFTENANMIPSLAKAMASEGINYVGDKVNNIFNPVIPAITGVKNFMGFEGTPETRDQEEFMTNLIRDKVLNSGSLTGSIDYTDYGSKTADHPSGDWTGGFFGPEFAYGTTLGKADYSVDSETGKVNWTGGTDYDFPKGWLGNKFIENTVNTGGLSNMTGGKPQQYIPNITIPPRDMMNIFSGGKRVHMNEPVIQPPILPPQGPAGFTQPTVQPPAAPVVPTYNPPQGPAGFTRPTRSPAQQAAAVNRKAKSMGVKSPIRRAPGTKYGFGL